YDPMAIISKDSSLQRVMLLLEDGHFNQFEPGIFDSIIASLKSSDDSWMTIADFRSYVEAQKRVEAAFQDRDKWLRMSILNCAASGKFSTDRTIQEYNRDIWKLTTMPVDGEA
ncbi:MAG: glycogen/starch/alpha-glucan phosphorylase, partial [Methylovulum sp.]|nr:glycogen/starch/alpha-glucan phosphorylase [Methylovulum sp.]